MLRIDALCIKMESKLPKPTSLKKPVPRTCIPSDRIVSTGSASSAYGSTLPSQNNQKSFTVPLPSNRSVLTQNFENVRSALGGAGPRLTRKRHASPDLNVRVVRPKLRRSLSVNDLNSMVTLTSMKPTKSIGLPLNGLTAKIRRHNLMAPRTYVRDMASSKPTTTTTLNAAAKATTLLKPPVKPSTTATTKATATTATIKGNAKPRIAPYDYKARFADLSDRHKALRQKYDALSENLKEYENLPEQYDECQQNLFRTENELRNVKVQLQCLERQTTADKIKIVNLTEQLQTKTEQYRVCDEANQTLRQKNETIKVEVGALRVEKTGLSSKNVSLEEQLREAKEIMYRFNLERKDLHNTIMDLRGNIRVFCRVRPPLDDEVSRTLCAWQYYDDTSLEIGSSIFSRN